MKQIQAFPSTHPRPRITSSSILSIGVIATALAYVSPYLLLIVTAILSLTIPYAFRENDDGESRRRLWADFEKRPDLPEAMKCKDVDLEEKYWTNNRGMCLLTSVMAPKNNQQVKGVICFCHGYMDNVSFLKRVEYQRFVKKGFAVVMIEYEGHGRSDGISTFIPCWNTLIEDVEQYFREVTNAKFPNKKKFLMGESMGGAVAFDVMSRNRSEYEGVLFVCPMVKVSIAPPKIVVDSLRALLGEPGTVNAFSMLPLAPSKGNIPDLSFKNKEKMRLAISAPTSYGRKPRLGTAREILETTERISKSVSNFDAPFIILHGLSDFVTCPKMSEDFYNESCSKDKQIKLYKGMYHNLTCGNTEEEVETVFNDAISWVLERSKNPVEDFISKFPGI
jgi:alpha-beta hydrolase superfamily lysophospholipase